MCNARRRMKVNPLSDGTLCSNIVHNNTVLREYARRRMNVNPLSAGK